jgi:hypothetical protein
VDGIAAERGLAAGDRLWCVKPVQLGEDFDAACRPAPDTRLQVVARQETADSTIIGYELR